MEYPNEHVFGLLTVEHQVREASVEVSAGDGDSRMTISTPLSSDGIAQIMNELRGISSSIAQMSSEINSQMATMNSQMATMNSQMVKMNRQIICTNLLIISTIVSFSGYVSMKKIFYFNLDFCCDSVSQEINVFSSMDCCDLFLSVYCNVSFD